MVRLLGHRQTKGAATDNTEPKATAPHLDSTYTVEKLRFEISGDFICDLSVILYSRYEGVVEIR